MQAMINIPPAVINQRAQRSILFALEKKRRSLTVLRPLRRLLAPAESLSPFLSAPGRPGYGLTSLASCFSAMEAGKGMYPVWETNSWPSRDKPNLKNCSTTGAKG